ncbi:TorF family putative porin [Pseudoroseomonas cervicalis]|uniref:TorF family putative porin n=1 Tax=Teichococcus cervicalis TaxID=204525 RepID=UPI001FDF7E6F|nr:TorF family putative porin [Pseudoroseomonas cervicalis]
MSLGIFLPALPAAAQTEIDSLGLTVTATPSVSSDYLFRGISQTRNRPAIQLTLDAQHESGFYVGAFASNVTFPGSNARQELDLLAGYRFEVAGVSLDIGGVYYTYPGYDRPSGSYDYNYVEAIAKASYTLEPVKLVATAAWSPNFYFESGSAVYVEGGADISLPFDFTLAGRLGYQWIERNTRYGAPDYTNWSVAVTREIVGGFMLTVGYYDTDLSKAQCFGGTKLCDARAMVTLSRAF